MKDTYTIPGNTCIGHVHLKVSDLNHSLDFYCSLLGFNLISKFGNEAAFISAGGYHHHIGLNTWYSKNTSPGTLYAPGLFHLAILYPTRKDLSIIYKRLIDEKYMITGVADHGVSEAIYLSDPDENGIELYRDKPKEEWPVNQDGNIEMFTKPLDVQSLLNELKS